MTKMPTVGFYTLGCKVSQYETEAVAEAFEKEDFTVSPFSAPCDFYVINTCTVTAESDRKCRQIIRRARRQNPKSHVLVCGCYSQRSPEEVAKIDGISAVVGSFGKMELPLIAKRLSEGKAPFADSAGKVKVSDIDKEPFEPMRITKGPRTRVYVKIEDGCESKCTYCAISSARGSVRSKPLQEVVDEVEALSASGVREIVLTGIETGSYGADLENGITLASLIALLDERKSAERIRLGSLAPELVGEKFAKAVAGLKILAPQFHISIQSGSNAVLRRMKRRYSAERAMENIKRLRELIPEAEFTTDLMVGFPAETEEDFNQTKEFLKEAEFLACHVFAYSRREGTPAAEYPDQISEQTKKRRSEELISLAAEVRDRVLDRVVKSGRILPSIMETKSGGAWYGHSDSFLEVAVIDACGLELQGKSVELIPTEHKNGIVICRLKR